MEASLFSAAAVLQFRCMVAIYSSLSLPLSVSLLLLLSNVYLEEQGSSKYGIIELRTIFFCCLEAVFALVNTPVH